MKHKGLRSQIGCHEKYSQPQEKKREKEKEKEGEIIIIIKKHCMKWDVKKIEKMVISTEDCKRLYIIDIKGKIEKLLLFLITSSAGTQN